VKANTDPSSIGDALSKGSLGNQIDRSPHALDAALDTMSIPTGRYSM